MFMVYKVGQYPWIMLYWTRLEGDVYGLQGESATPVEVFCFVFLIIKQFNIFFVLFLFLVESNVVVHLQ